MGFNLCHESSALAKRCTRLQITVRFSRWCIFRASWITYTIPLETTYLKAYIDTLTYFIIDGNQYVMQAYMMAKCEGQIHCVFLDITMRMV